MKTTVSIALLLLLLPASPAGAKVGDPVAGFMGGTLIHQLLLTPQGQSALSGSLAGRTLHRFVSDDRAITVDLVVWNGLIEQQLMYVPMDVRRGFQVNMFLQDAVGSLVGAQQGMIAYRAAVANRSETYIPFRQYTMRFTPLDANLLRVLVTQ